MSPPGTGHAPARDAALRIHLAGLSPRQREELVSRASGPSALAEAGFERLRDWGLAPEAARRLAEVGPAELEAERRTCRALGVRLVHHDDPDFPELLRELPDPPRLLWVRGSLPRGRLPIAVVGPRRPTTYGLAMARHLSAELARRHVLVVSGGARGIDGVAHSEAVSAGAPTVAILGCGVDVAYPPEHRALFEAIVGSGGAVVSEHPCGTPPLARHFPVRNRLLAGWARAVIVVEATLRSGTLVTARLALEADREVLAVPGPVTSIASAGTNELIARGARLTRGIDDLVAELPPDEQALLALRSPDVPGAEKASGGRGDGGEGAEDPVLSCLDAVSAQPLDQLAEATGLPVAALLARLVELESRGLVHGLEGGRWVRSAP